MVVPSYGLQSVRTFSLLPSRQTPPMYCLFSLTNWFINGPSAGVGTAKLRNADSSVTLRSRFGEWEKRVGSRTNAPPRTRLHGLLLGPARRLGRAGSLPLT